VSGREGGSGLGLTLAQTFVQHHHGVIECDSEPGRTTFTVLLPLVQRPREAAQPDEAQPAAPQAARGGRKERQ